VKQRDNELLSKDKDNNDTLHRLKVSYEKIQSLESSLTNLREEVDALINRNTEIKKNSENLHEKLA